MRLYAQRIKNILLGGQGLTRDRDFANGESRLGKIALGNATQRIGQLSDRLTHLIKGKNGGKQHGHHRATADQSAMQHQGPVEKIGKLTAWRADGNRQRAGVH